MSEARGLRSYWVISRAFAGRGMDGQDAQGIGRRSDGACPRTPVRRSSRAEGPQVHAAAGKPAGEPPLHGASPSRRTTLGNMRAEEASLPVTIPSVSVKRKGEPMIREAPSTRQHRPWGSPGARGFAGGAMRRAARRLHQCRHSRLRSASPCCAMRSNPSKTAIEAFSISEMACTAPRSSPPACARSAAAADA